MKKQILVICLALLSFLPGNLLEAQNTFTNPLIPAKSADPFVFYKDGFYYFMITENTHISVRKTERLEDVNLAEPVTVWTSPVLDPVPDGWPAPDTVSGYRGSNIWAPEINYINGRWYIYASGDNLNYPYKSNFVIVGDTADAQKPYSSAIFLAKGIDGSVWQDPATDKIYFSWTGDKKIRLAEMSSPTELVANSEIIISQRDYPWEFKGPGGGINEGPVFLQKNKKVHIVYSSSATKGPDYVLGMLTCSNGDYMNISSWEKSSVPVFMRQDENEVWGTGHNCFTKSPDGTEDWIVYHAKEAQKTTKWDRGTRMQKFAWDENDYPIFGEPYPTYIPLPLPSDGTLQEQNITIDAVSDKTIDASYFTLTGTSDKGLPLTFHLQYGPATVTPNGQVSLLGKPGNIRVYATQEGNDTVAAAWPVFADIKVTSDNIEAGKGDGLNAAYYNGTSFGTKILERTDATINFEWGANSPATGVNADNFSVKWTGFVEPLYSDLYYFSIISDNGRLLKVDGKLVIDQFTDEAGDDYWGSVYLTAGEKHAIEVQFKELDGNANIKMYWWSKSQEKELVPQSQLYTTTTSGKIVFHFPFDGSLADASGNEVVLINPHQNNTFYSTDATGKYGEALTLSGASGTYLQIEQAGLLDPAASDYTVCAWVKNTSVTSHLSEHVILHQNAKGTGATRYLLACNGTDNLSASTFIGGALSTSTGNINRNEWTHLAIVATRANNNLKFYINGDLDSEATARNFESSTHGFFLGQHKSGNTKNWVGLIDELYLCNIALNKAQVNQLMNNEELKIVNQPEITSEADFMVYPNPAKDYVHISSKEIPQQLTLFNLEGKMIISTQNSNRINTSDLQDGMYFLHCRFSNGNTNILKVIIERC